MNLHRIITLCMLLPLAIAYGYAQHAKHSTEITVFFRVNSSSIDLGYFGNAESLTSLDKTIDMFRMNIDSVSIVAYASPEGNFAYNVELSSRRAAAMHNFLVNRYNDVDFKNIKEVVGGPDFDGLSRRIEADTQVPYRKEVLDIVRNWGSDPVATFRKLKALRNGVPYNYISYHYLPWLRTATTVIFHYNASVSLYKEQNQQITVSENSSYVLPEAFSRARARDERGNQTGAVSVPCTGTKNTAGNNDNPLAGLPGSGAPAGNVATVPVHGNQPDYSVLPILDQQAGSDAEAVYAAGYAAGYAAASSGAPYGQGVYANQPQGGSAGQGGAAGATGAGAAGARAGYAQGGNAGQGAAAGAGAAGAGAAAYGQSGQGSQSGAAAGAGYGQGSNAGQGAAAGAGAAGAGAGAGAAAYGQGGQGSQSGAGAGAGYAQGGNAGQGAAAGAGAAGAGAGAGAAAYGQGGQGSQSGAAAGAGYGQGSNAGQGSSTGAAAAAGYGDGNRSDNKDNKGGQDGAKSFTFVFPVGGSEIDTTRADNAEALQALRQTLADGYIVEGSRVMVHAYASPDGSAKANKMLSQRRAESAVVFLEDVLPEDTKVDYVSEGENWEGFKESVEKNYNRPDRDKVLAFLNSDKSVDEKKKEINKLDPESRKELVGKTSESLRSVKVTLLPPEEKPEEKAEEKPEEKAEQAPVVIIREADTTVVAPVAVDTTSAVAAIAGKFAADSTVVAPVDSLANQAAVDSTKQRKPRGTVVALKTNLLYDLVTAVNVEVEIPIAKRFSIAVENVFPWWETGNKYCFQLWEMGIEGRIWLKAWDVRGREKLRGLFAGIYGMSGKYDFQFDRKINYQGEFWSVGATIGYSMPLGRKEWGNLEFSVSDGYLESPYRHYYPTEDYSKLLRDRGNQGTLYSYFVYPTKAKVSLVIPIPGKKKKEANHE